MGLFDNLKSKLSGGRVDLSARFDRQRKAISGTMSSFSLAFDSKTHRKVGLKVLDPQKTAAFEARFKGLQKPTEGQIATTLRHPRLVETFEYGVSKQGEQFLVMEYLEGPGLNSLIVADSPLLQENLLTLIRQAAEAVAAVHEAGYIHRDICPRNFVVDPSGASLKLIDFGLTVPATERFLQPGDRTGTPQYMAPEIVRRRRTDHRLDIFALGVTAYEMCSRRLPWESVDTTGKAALAHDTKPPLDLAQLRPDLEPDLVAAIMQCLAVRPDERPPTAADLLDQLGSLRCAVVQPPDE